MRVDVSVQDGTITPRSVKNPSLVFPYPLSLEADKAAFFEVVCHSLTVQPGLSGDPVVQELTCQCTVHLA